MAADDTNVAVASLTLETLLSVHFRPGATLIKP